jgi:hypothetical protein
MSSHLNLNKTMDDISMMRLTLSPSKPKRTIIPLKVCKRNTSNSVTSDFGSTSKHSSDFKSISDDQSENASCGDNICEGSLNTHASNMWVTGQKFDFDAEILNIESVAPKFVMATTALQMSQSQTLKTAETSRPLFLETENLKLNNDVNELNLYLELGNKNQHISISSQDMLSKLLQDTSRKEISEANSGSAKLKSCSEFKALLRDLKRFLVTRYRK